METTNGSSDSALQKMNTLENGEETTEQKTMMKIWIAVDESDGSFYALEWALQHLFLQHDATNANKEPPFTVTVVHVQPPFQPTYTALPVGPVLFATSGMKESVAKAEEESAAKILARASELCDQHKIKAEYLVLKGNPKEILIEAVEQMDVDLLVVGSRGLGQIKRAVLGSISDHCAHHAKCPVLIVRPQKASQN
uniref:universal stress protein YxiE-like n=1 Tax=Erigeron canadensis TaxID=72917 RepID=UPI001CB9CBF3|nr:universal stress protein YxiE-like [Erigeron canadensis]